VDLLEQVAVAVEEGAVDGGGAGDAGDADLLPGSGCGADRRGDTAASPCGVGLATAERGLRLAVEAGHAVRPGRMSGRGLAHPGHPERDRAVAPDEGDGLADLLALGGGEVFQAGLDAGDEAADRGDLLAGEDGLGSCPLVDLGSGEDPFPVAEQVIEAPLLGLLGLAAVYGVLRWRPWGAPAALAASAVNVVSALIAMAVSSPGRWPGWRSA
jgi:hypothetical protein